jgi:hypothetical protein
MFPDAWSFHIFAVVTVAAGLGLLWRIAHSPFGRTLQALRDNEQRAQSLGYDTFRLKFASFVLMGGFIGYAGGLLSLMLKGAYADNLSWQHAGDSLLMAVLGGVHHFLGPLWGAIAFPLEDRLSALTESWWLMFAPIGSCSPCFAQGMQGLAPARAHGSTRPGIPPGRPPSPWWAGMRRSTRRSRSSRSAISTALRLAGRGQRCQPGGSSLSAAQPHRPKRRRQDDLLQHADRAAAPDSGVVFDGHDITRLPGTGASGRPVALVQT